MNAGPPLLDIALDAAAIARKLIQDGTPGVLTPKGDRDMATELDFQVERTLRDFLRERTPDLGFLGEEEGAAGVVDGADRPTWVLDPIDGTVNLTHGIPLVGVSLALVDGDQPTLGVIDLPFQDARYWATDGQGAYVDGTRIEVSRTKRLDQAIVALGDFSVSADAEAKNHVRIALLKQLASNAQRVRMLGSAAIDLAWVAHGRLDASITLVNNPWDMAAGVAIAREAGAEVTDRDGTRYTLASTATVAGPPTILSLILEAIREVESQRTPGATSPLDTPEERFTAT
jgi:myo-inositol-1(or 4)-monophosphatase